ncbi:MAG: ComEC/Rec2 family competence protein [Bacteroidota bacterium]
MYLRQQLRVIPFVRILLPFLLGIIIQIRTGYTSDFLYILLSLCFLLLIVTGIMQLKFFVQRNEWFFGAMLNIFMLLSGFCISGLQVSKLLETGQTGSISCYTADILESISEKEKTYKANVIVTAVKKEGIWIPLNGKALLYFEKDSLSQKLKAGDRIVFAPVLEEIRNSGNPNQFDYKNYLLLNHISMQAFIKKGQWLYAGKVRYFSINAKASGLRDRMIGIFEKNGIEGDEFSVASALTLGYKDMLDDDIKMTYSSSGAMHVLAVSGLHVGIIYLIFNSILFFLDRKTALRIVKVLILLLILWFYACLTGLSPSVLRATVMFSFIIAGKAFGRQVNIYNSIAASAFLLLLINPYMLMDVGFQLSYLAVLGIVFIQPKLYRLVIIRNKILDKTWALFSVSVAAQIATMPVSLYYFHQFPNYFFLTNLAVIPMATIILCLGIAVLATSVIPEVSEFLAIILEYAVAALNKTVAFIENLPGAVTRDIAWDAPETIMLYVLIVSVALFFIYHRARFFYTALLFVAFIIVYNMFIDFKAGSGKRFIVYNIGNNSVIDFIDGTRSVLLTGQTDLDSKAMSDVKSNWIKSGVSHSTLIDRYRLIDGKYLDSLNNQECIPVFIWKNYLKYEGRSLVLVNSEEQLIRKPISRLKVNYVVLSDNARVDIEKVIAYYDADTIIIDSSNSFWMAEKWEDECRQLNVPCHVVKTKGAFICDLSGND